MRWHCLFLLKHNFVAWMFTCFASWVTISRRVMQTRLNRISTWKTSGLLVATSMELLLMLLEKSIGTKFKGEEILAIGVIAWKANMNNKEKLALQDLIDCTEHYLLIGHIQSQYDDAELRLIEYHVNLMKRFLTKIKLNGKTI